MSRSICHCSLLWRSAIRKDSKAELGSDQLHGVPLETYMPSEKLAIEPGSADENIEIMKAYMCKQRGIRLISCR